MKQFRILAALAFLLLGLCCFDSRWRVAAAAEPLRHQDSLGTDCRSITSPALPGVYLELTTLQWTYSLEQAKSGISIEYQVVIDHDLSGVRPIPMDTGQCERPGLSGLIVSLRLSGNGQLYCLCDIGSCPPHEAEPVVLKSGIYAGEFIWGGHNWTGPSDVDHPKGALFPPGIYTVTLSAKGERLLPDGTRMPFELTGSCDLRLTP